MALFPPFRGLLCCWMLGVWQAKVRQLVFHICLVGSSQSWFNPPDASALLGSWRSKVLYSYLYVTLQLPICDCIKWGWTNQSGKCWNSNIYQYILEFWYILEFQYIKQIYMLEFQYHILEFQHIYLKSVLQTFQISCSLQFLLQMLVKE